MFDTRPDDFDCNLDAPCDGPEPVSDCHSPACTCHDCDPDLALDLEAERLAGQRDW